MVGFIIPIPGKVVDNVYAKGAQLRNSYKKDAPPTDLSAPMEEKSVGSPLPPPTRRGSSNLPPPTRSNTGGARAPPAAPSAGAGARRAPPPMAHQARAGPAAAAADADAFGTRLLAHVLDSISLLESMGHITPEAAEEAAAALQGVGAEDEVQGYSTSPVAMTPTAPPTRAAAPPPPAAAAQDRATALWDYGQSGDPDDLKFSAGDTIIIDEEVNDEWYRGRCIPQGRSVPLPKKGLFPSNYVERQ